MRARVVRAYAVASAIALSAIARARPAAADLGPPRWFVSTTIDAGYLYLRPRLSTGYGIPFRLWAGIDANPIVTSTGLGAYSGLRFQIPWFDLRLGARGFMAFQHTFLPPQAHYSSVDLELENGSPARYVTAEAELSGGIPAGPGSILLVLTASGVFGATHGRFVYEETLRVITDPPEIYRARAGYALALGSEGAAHVGLVGESLFLPRRHDVVVRAGLVASFTIDEHLEALALLVIPVFSPDTIGISGGDYGELGLRYRWATR
jgi:hypothetical protein